MQKVLYDDYRDKEETHWWFAGRKTIFTELLRQKNIPRPIKHALDIGCGTGFLTTLVTEIADSVYCVEMADEMIATLKERSEKIRIIKGFWPDVAVDKTFSFITLFDSLEHIEDEAAALKKIESVLEPGGVVLITVPAYQFLWSEHDDHNQHKRRYTKTSIRSAIEKSTDLTIIRQSYFNSFLFPLIALVRLAKDALGIKTGGSDIVVPPKPLNSFLSWLFGAERILLRWFNLPFGTSLLCIARKEPR